MTKDYSALPQLPVEQPIAEHTSEVLKNDDHSDMSDAEESEINQEILQMCED